MKGPAYFLTPFEHRNPGELKEMEISVPLQGRHDQRGAMKPATVAKSLPQQSYAPETPSHPAGVIQARNRERTDANKPTKNTPTADFVKCEETFSVPGAMVRPEDLKGQERNGN